MKNLKTIIIAILAAFLLFGCISATEAKDLPDSHSDPYIEMILGQVAFMEGRITSLAEAIPEDDYNWRPDEGVRSTSEQLVHTLAAGYFITSMMGGEKPDNITQDLEKTLTAKVDILKELKASFKAVTKFLESYDTTNYEKMVKTPFGEYTQRMMILILNNHYHEHLGSLITYGRANGVVPPWSEKPEEH